MRTASANRPPARGAEKVIARCKNIGDADADAWSLFDAKRPFASRMRSA
jgi:hypothetical protein